MAEKAKPSSPDRQVQFGSKTLTLRFSLKAVLALQDLWGLSTEEEVHARLASSKNKISDFVDVVWAALRTHHADMSRDDVLELADEAGLEGLTEALGQVMEAAMPPPEAGQDGARNPPKGKRVKP